MSACCDATVALVTVSTRGEMSHGGGGCVCERVSLLAIVGDPELQARSDEGDPEDW
jgi:hypothetical protein